jgi:hypothetical protein
MSSLLKKCGHTEYKRMPRKAANLGQIKPKSRGLYTPEPVRGRVLARHMNGESNREIARIEGIDRETVGRILSQQEVVNLIAQNQARLLSLVPKAISHSIASNSNSAVNRLAGSAHAIFTTRTPWLLHSLRGGSACTMV